MELIYYLVTINIIALFAYGIDKQKAMKNKWRISEQALLMFALVGGGVGSLLGMSLFRHKTRKLKFLIGIPLLTIFSVIIIVIVLQFFA